MCKINLSFLPTLRSKKGLSQFHKIKLKKILDVKSTNELDEVISFIEARLNAILTNKQKEGKSAADTTTPSVSEDTWIKCGYNFLGKVINHAKKHSSKILNSDTRKVVIELLNGLGQTHWVAAGLGVVAYVLDQMDKASTNTDECIHFLKTMCNLAKQIKQLDKRLDEEKLKDVVALIVKGSFFCISRMDSNNFYRFLYASPDAEELKSLQSQLFQTYLDLTLEGIIQILNPNDFLPPTMGEDPKAVGIDEARDAVVKLLDLKDQSIRSVVLYGLGGMGKTTLATAVVSSLRDKLSAYKCCRINIENDCSESNVRKLQEQVLLDLFNQRTHLRDCIEVKNHILNLFREATSQPVFLFIDNALRGSDLAKLLPEDLSCLPNRSRILITTRNRADMIERGGVMIEEGGVKRCAYRVKSLSDDASVLLLRRKALDSAYNFFDPRMNIHALVKICGGVPQVLNSAAIHLRKLDNNVGACESTIDFLKDTIVKGEGSLSKEVVDVVYNALKEDLFRDAFLDIAAFINNWDERMVGYIVGEVALQALKGAALVKINERGKVIVDGRIVQARGRKLSEDDRITGHRELRRVLRDPQKLEKLKGVWLPPPDDSDEFQFPAKNLELMNRSLRVLHLAERNRLEGETKETFPDLRLLHTTGDLGMEWTKLERLAVLQAYLKKWDGSSDSSCLLNFPGSVYHLKLNGYNLPGISEYLSNLSRIEELCLSSSSGSLPDSFCQRKSLRLLEIVNCPDLKCLPDNFGHLSSLKILNLTRSGLICLPDSFGQLSCLEELNISECRELLWLPLSFSDLNLLKKLNISYCVKLSRLPDDFSKLKNLKNLNMSGCSILVMIPDDFEQLSSACAVDASYCSILEGNAMDKLLKMKSLLVLKIQESPMLAKRWREVKEITTVNAMPALIVEDGESKLHEHPVSTALFHKESKFLHHDGHLQCAEWLSGPGKVAFVLSMCDLSWPSFDKVKQEIAELASKGFQIVYVGVGQNMEGIRHNLIHLPLGTCAWIAPDEKWNILAGYSILRLILPHDGQALVSSLHTLVASASVSVDEKGEKHVEDIKLTFSVPGDGEGLKDIANYFSYHIEFE